MLDIFTTDKYDNLIAVNNGKDKYTYSDLKRYIAGEIEDIRNKKTNVIITSGDNFSFIILFFAALFCNKKIFLLTDKARLSEFNNDYDVLESYASPYCTDYKFPDIDINKPVINFFTSGSSGKPKIITKSLYNIIREAKDVIEELSLKNKNLYVLSTTSMCHMFGMTFHLMVPLCAGFIIYTKEIAYPENVNVENSILVSTPSFLSSVLKHNLPFTISPELIFSAGSKLNENVFSHLEKNSDVVEIYGSTETGVIAYKRDHNDELQLFKNVSINVNQDNVEVKSDYFFEDSALINDNIEVDNNKLIIKNRTDRLYKIYEKRVCASELENNLKQFDFVSDCYIIKSNEKLACLCALSENGKNFLLENNITTLTKKLKKYLSHSSEIVPQKWKFIDEIPMTSTGKTDKKLIEHLFNINFSLPVILDRKISENSIIYSILFYKQSNFYKGHFPEFAITPGVVQLYFAKELANNHFKLNLGQGQWKRIKFSNIIEPDTIVKLKLDKSDTSVNYEYYTDSKIYSSGSFLCNNVFKGVYQ